MILHHRTNISTFPEFIYCMLRGVVHGSQSHSVQTGGKWYAVGFKRCCGRFVVQQIERPEPGEPMPGNPAKFLKAAKRREGSKWRLFFNDCNKPMI